MATADFDVDKFIAEAVEDSGNMGREPEKDAPRRRSRSRSRDRKHKSRSGERRYRDERRSSSHRDREREYSGRRDRDRGDDRSRDRREHRSSRGDRDRSDRDRSERDRGSERRRSSRRSPSASPEKLPVRSPSPANSEEREERKAAKRREREIAELTRDQRTVFVSQMQVKVTDRHLRKYIEQAGKVVKVELIKDKSTNRSKGFAYVELENLEDVPKALMLSGQNICLKHKACVCSGFPCMVKASEAEKNFMKKQEKAAEAAAGVGDANSTPLGMSGMVTGREDRLYVGNLHVNLVEDDIKAVFSQLGTVLDVNLQRNEMGVSKGYAFVRYSSPAEATNAIEKLNGMDLAGRPIKVNVVNDPSTTANAVALAGANGGHMWKLDDEAGQGVSLNANTRVALMQRLAGNAGMAVPAMPVMAAAVPAMGGMMMGGVGGMGMMGAGGMVKPAAPPITGMPSLCLVLNNMFVLEEENEEGWEVDIKEDVEEECSKHGVVLHSYVETRQSGGMVYLMFASLDGSSKAAATMNGRFFAGRQITVRYIPQETYIDQFPEARVAAMTAAATAANAHL